METTGCSDFTLAGTNDGTNQDVDGTYTFQGYYGGRPYYLRSDYAYYIYVYADIYWLVTDASSLGLTTYWWAAYFNVDTAYSPIDVTEWQASHDNLGTYDSAVYATSLGGTCPPTFAPSPGPTFEPTSGSTACSAHTFDGTNDGFNTAMLGTYIFGG